MKTPAKLWVGLAILAFLTPLGFLLPKYFKAGDAWGEWGTDTLKELIGYVPRGLEKLSTLWRAPFADYTLKGWKENGLRGSSFSYIISALIGIAVTVLVVVLIGKLLTRKKTEELRAKGIPVRGKSR